MADDDETLPPVGRFGRFRKLAVLSVQLGTGVVTQGVRRLAGADPDMFDKGAAEKLVATLGDLKGAAMKFGQAVSMDADLFSPEVRRILARLQNEAPSMPYSRVREVVEEDLGAPPESVFASFSSTPLAAASLGQVHQATLKDGRKVAVKVQYPGIAQALGSDLDNLKLMVKALAVSSKALDGRAYFQEFYNELAREVDYRREAALCKAFAQSCAPFTELKVPEVVDSHTGLRVLTLELIEGPTLKEVIASQASAEERYRVSRLLIRAVYGPFLLSGEVHADPHPGNFIVMADGRLGVLDFGSVKRFSPVFVDALRQLFLRAVKRDDLDVLALCRRVGFSIELPDEQAAPLIRELLHIAGRPLRTPEYDYAQCKVAPDIRSFATKNLSSMLKMRPPSEAVMFFRAIGGCSQNLRALGGKGDYGAIYRELAELIP